jgi:hypothetical protein
MSQKTQNFMLIANLSNKIIKIRMGKSLRAKYGNQLKVNSFASTHTLF